MAERTHDGWWQHCATCGDRIGIYERVWVEHHGGRFVSSYLNLHALMRSRAHRFWHLDCPPPGSTPPA